MGIFKRKTLKEKLQEKHKKLLERAYKMSHANRKEADKLMAEAEEVYKQMEQVG